MSLRLILRINSSARGTRAKLDSPDMGIAGLEIEDLTHIGSAVHLRVPFAKVVFDGELSSESSSVSGLWKRDGQADAAITFTRSEESARIAANRPQTPRPPFTYDVDDVSFSNPQARIALSGTLTTPKGAGPFPAAILVSGSGPQDRDESGFGHKPFSVLADRLTREGIAVLRFDDRGVGKSEGDFGSATTEDFASDVCAAIAYMTTQPKIRRDAIGLIGHSQGGVVGPMAARHNPSVAYLVLLAAPATSMTELLLSQRRMSGVLQGQSEASLAVSEPTLTKLYEAVAKADDKATARSHVELLLTADVMKKLGISESLKPAALDQLTSEWLRVLLHYDATATLSAIHVPVLALDGSLDRLVEPEANLAAIRKALRGNHDVTVNKMAGLNHMFQTARSGAIAEFRDIDETFAPAAMDLISEWIDSRFGKPGSAETDRAARTIEADSTTSSR